MFSTARPWGFFADFDNDGDDDLGLILQNAEPVLFTNDGRGSFQRTTSTQFERADGARTTYSSAAAADYDGDSHVDIYVTACIAQPARSKSPDCGDPKKVSGC